MNKKSVLIVGVCIAVLAVAGFFGVLPHMEKRFEEDAAAFLRLFSGTARSVKADLLGGKLTLTDVRLSYDQLYGGLIKGTFAADEIIFRGFNRKAPDPEGSVRKIADSVEMTGVDIRYAAFGTEEHRIRLKTLTEHDVSGDLSRLRVPAMSEPGIKGAAERLDAFRAFHCGAISGTGYEAEMEMAEGGGKVQVTADGFRLKDATLFKGSDFVCDNIKMGYMGMDMLSMDSMSVAFSSVPDYYMPLLEDEAARLEGTGSAARSARFMRGFARALEQAPLTVKGLKIVNLAFPFVRSGIKEVLADVQLAARDVSLRVNFAGVDLPASVYAMGGGWMSRFARAYNGGALNLDASLDLEAIWKGRDGEIRLKKFFLEDKNLASAEISGNLGMNGLGESWLENLDGKNKTDFLLKDMRAALTDRKLLDIACGDLAIDKGAPGGTAAIRARWADNIWPFDMADKAGQEKGQDYMRIMEGLAELARAPGSLTVSLRPDKAIPLKKLGRRDAVWDLNANATVEYSPAGNGEGSK